MGGRRFQPGDIVMISSGLSSYEYISGESMRGNNIGSLIYGDRTGIVIGVTSTGYNVDFGLFEARSCISIPETLLTRA